jgi:hypothetical protein
MPRSGRPRAGPWKPPRLAASLGFLFEHEAQPDKFENIP